MTPDYEILWPHLYHHGKLVLSGEETDFEALLQVLEVGREEIAFGRDDHTFNDRQATIKIADNVIFFVRQVARQLKEYNALVGI